MANQNKTPVPGKAKGNPNNKRIFKIEKDKPNELDLDIEVEDDGSNSTFEVDKFSIEGLPPMMKDGTPIRWFNNFGIRRSGQYINQKYKVIVPGLSNFLGNSKLVIFDGNGDPYIYTGDIVNDTFELTDGDPAAGGSP